jgi:hypothetical protein
LALLTGAKLLLKVNHAAVLSAVLKHVAPWYRRAQPLAAFGGNAVGHQSAFPEGVIEDELVELIERRPSQY